MESRWMYSKEIHMGDSDQWWFRCIRHDIWRISPSYSSSHPTLWKDEKLTKLPKMWSSDSFFFQFPPISGGCMLATEGGAVFLTFLMPTWPPLRSRVFWRLSGCFGCFFFVWFWECGIMLMWHVVVLFSRCSDMSGFPLKPLLSSNPRRNPWMTPKPTTPFPPQEVTFT